MGTFWDGWIASEGSDHDAIKVKRIYIDLNDGNLYDGILFSQIMYWHGRNRETGKPRLSINRDGHLWLAKSYDDWWDECRINAATARKCVERIIKRDLLVKRLWKFDNRPIVHLRVNVEAFEQQLNYLLHEQGSIRPVVSNRLDTTGQIDLIPQVKSITETTSKTTTEKDIAPAGADAATPPKTRQRDPLFDAVQLHIFGIALDQPVEGGRVARISNWLNGKYAGKGATAVGKISAPAEPEHVAKFAAWCKREGFTPPLDVVKFVEQWRKWATSAQKRTANSTVIQSAAPIVTLTLEEMERRRREAESVRAAMLGGRQ